VPRLWANRRVPFTSTRKELKERGMDMNEKRKD